jgi:hypothetical protein
MKFNMRANVQIGAHADPRNDQDRCKIQYNDFGASVYACNEQGSLSGQCSQFVEVDHNWFHGTAGAESGDIIMEYDFGARHWIVHHNVFWQGSYAKGEIPFGPPFVRGQSWTWDWADTTSSTQQGGVCFNNTVVDSNWVLHRDRYILVTNEGVQAPMMRDPYFKNNLWAKSDTAPWKFTDARGRDFTLRAGSPAIDKGVVIPGWLTTYQGSAPDLGAYEYGEPRWTAGADWKPTAWTWYPPVDVAVAAGRSPASIGPAFHPRLVVVPRGLRIDAPRSAAYQVRIFDLNGAVQIARDVPRGGSIVIAQGRMSAGIYVVRIIGRDFRASWKVLFR